MTENTIWFAVTSEESPKPSDAFYNLREIWPKQLALPTDYAENMFVSIEKGVLGGKVKCYRATTHFTQLEALSELFEQYGMHLIFFGFTGYDTDFSDYGLSHIPR